MAGRNCLVCGDPSLLEIDAALLEGNSTLSEISQQFRISRDSLWRHSQSHLTQIARSTLRDQEISLVADYAQRLQEAADDIRAARIRAAESNSVLQMTRAAETEVKILKTLADRFGITSTTAVAEVKAAVGILQASFDLAIERPDVIELMAVTLGRRGDHEQAQQVRDLADRARKNKKEIVR